MPQKKIGLILSGGGARGAYQAGVMQAIAEIREKNAACRPIRIITGLSAGAVNASYMAARDTSELKTAKTLTMFWRSLTSDQVFRTDPLTIGRTGLAWLSDTTVGALYRRKRARSLLDTTPLRELLTKNINFEKIAWNITNGQLDAFSIAALNYSNAHNISFVMAKPETQMWFRTRRKSEFTTIGVEHIMASAAIPLFFPPIHMAGEYYGDGCLRNMAPMSAPIHLGADKLLVVSVRRPEDKAKNVAAGLEPSLARVLGVMINALLMDAVEFDMERLNRINSTLDYVPARIKSDLSLRKIETLWIRPSEDIGYLASGRFKNFPTVIRYMMAGLGSTRESSDLTSYLLFDPEYCSLLVELGYQDTMARKEEVIEFFSS